MLVVYIYGLTLESKSIVKVISSWLVLVSRSALLCLLVATSINVYPNVFFLMKFVVFLHLCKSIILLLFIYAFNPALKRCFSGQWQWKPSVTEKHRLHKEPFVPQCVLRILGQWNRWRLCETLPCVYTEWGALNTSACCFSLWSRLKPGSMHANMLSYKMTWVSFSALISISI